MLFKYHKINAITIQKLTVIKKSGYINLDNNKLKQLIEDCVLGNAKAQEMLYIKFSPQLYGICLRYAKNSADAEDILQDSFIRIFEKIGDYKFAGAFEGWLRRIVINTALQKIKENKTRELYTNTEGISDDLMDFNEISIPMNTLLQMIQNLPDRYRLVFNLYVLDNYKHSEIAEMLKISEGTSKSNLARARQILQQKVKHFMEERQ